jgi:hypothetical protein
MLCVAACSDLRPSEAKARSLLQRICPALVVVSIRISEDEVIARSFRVEYRDALHKIREIELQFLQEDGEWKPSPPLSHSCPQ